MRIGVVVGNPKPRSRTLALAERLAQKIDPSADRHVVDLVDYAERLFAWPDEHLADITGDLASRDLLIIGTPTYKATYSGLLKAFLDRYPHRGLEGVFTVPLMTVASPEHHMAPDVYLRPLLVELGAIAPTTSLAFPTPMFDQAERILEQWLVTNEWALTLVRTAASTRPSTKSEEAPDA